MAEQTKESSLESLIGKLKTSSSAPVTESAAPVTESADVARSSAAAAAGHGAVNGFVSDKKSRRKGLPQSTVPSHVMMESTGDEAMDVDIDDLPPTHNNSSTTEHATADSVRVDSTLQDVSAVVIPKEEVIPEDTVIVNPEAPSMEQEEEHNSHISPEMEGSELTSVNTALAKDTYQCTICKDKLYLKDPSQIREHPKLKVIICRVCYSFYTCGEFTKDSDGFDNQCTWCGEGGNLLVCDYCVSAFCKKCIRNNFKRDMIKQIERAKKWKCFVCDPKPLAVHVMHSSQLQNKLKEKAKKNKARNTSGVSVTNQNAASPRSRRNNIQSTAVTGLPAILPAVTGARGSAPPLSNTKNRGGAAPARPQTVMDTYLKNQTTARRAPIVAGDTRVHISVPSEILLPSQKKARLSVDLVSIMDKFIQSQHVRCDFKMLENIVLEHNKLGSRLGEFRQTLIKANEDFQHSRLSSALHPTAITMAKLAYAGVCDNLGSAVKKDVSGYVSSLTKMLSTQGLPAHRAGENGHMTQSQQTNPPPSQHGIQPDAHSPIRDIRKSVTNPVPLNSPQAGAPAMTRLTGAPVVTRPAGAASHTANKEYIDINELARSRKSLVKPDKMQVVDLCSDDNDDIAEVTSTTQQADAASNKTKRQNIESADTHPDKANEPSTASPITIKKCPSSKTENCPTPSSEFDSNSASTNTNPQTSPCMKDRPTTTTEFDWSHTTNTHLKSLRCMKDRPTTTTEFDSGSSHSDGDLVGVTPRRSPQKSLKEGGANEVPKDNEKSPPSGNHSDTSAKGGSKIKASIDQVNKSAPSVSEVGSNAVEDYDDASRADFGMDDEDILSQDTIPVLPSMDDLENADLAKSNSMPLSSSQQDSLQTTLTFPEDNELSLGSQSLGTELADRRGDADGDNVADGAKLGPEAMEVEPTNSQEILESATQRQSVCDGEQPGPSGLSKRTLRRILRDQQSESDSKTQSEHPDSSDTEAVTEPSKSKRQSLRKSKDLSKNKSSLKSRELISSSEDENTSSPLPNDASKNKSSFKSRVFMSSSEEEKTPTPLPGCSDDDDKENDHTPINNRRVKRGRNKSPRKSSLTSPLTTKAKKKSSEFFISSDEEDDNNKATDEEREKDAETNQQEEKSKLTKKKLGVLGDDTDDTATDTMDNAMAMNDLAKNLASSSDDSDSELLPRTYLGRSAKEPETKQYHKKKKLSAKLMSKQKRENKIDKLTPGQIRYMRGRARGLIISVKEKKQSKLQKLLEKISEKTTEEIDTENKLKQKCKVSLDKVNLEEKSVIDKLVSDYKQTSHKSAVKTEILQPSDGDSDLEREIKSLSKLQVMLNKSKTAQQSAHKGKSESHDSKTEETKTKKKKSAEAGESDLSELSDGSKSHDSGSENSDSEGEDKSDDIIPMPNKNEEANEEALQALLRDLSDSEGGALTDLSTSASDSDNQGSDSDKNKQKNKDRDRIRPEGRKLHRLEKRGLDGKKSKSRRVHSSGSESDFDVLSSEGDVGARKRKRKRLGSTDSGSGSAVTSSEGEIAEKLKSRDKQKKKLKSKKKRIVIEASDSDSDSDKSGKPDKSGSDSDSDIQEVATPHKGRKDIRRVLDDKKLKNATKSAHRLEMERRKRIEEKQKKYNVQLLVAESPQKVRYNELILEENKNGKIIVEVDRSLVKRLKPHQVEAVRFLWDCVCETVERSNKEKGGGGCILAHCMGLGKTLSVITFLHTLMCHEDILKLKRMLVICPLNTVINWKQETEKWTGHLEIDIDVEELSSAKAMVDRMYKLKRWHNTGGIMIIGYEMFRNLTMGTHIKKQEHKAKFAEYLLNPGPDVIICDEGHLLKNAKSGIRNAVVQIASKRRVVLTGTPLQNNLKEYHCMVDFVKPNLIGTANEFNNRFVAPITNGQYEDSTPYDVKLMKKRAHVLHEMLAGCVQRRDYSALTKFLPPKHEYILSMRLTDLQAKIYGTYLQRIQGERLGVCGKLFSDYQNLSRVWTHPRCLELHEERKTDKFIAETSEDTPSSSSDSDIQTVDSEGSAKSWKPGMKKKKKDKKEKTDSKDGVTNGEASGGSRPNSVAHVGEYSLSGQWWKNDCKGQQMMDVSLGNKFVLLLEILKKCEEIGDKLLLFSGSILALDLIEDFLDMISEEIEKGNDEITKSVYGTSKWKKGTNYFRIDGSVSAKHRSQATAFFNKPTNTKARLFLISTRAGGLGINLVGANRVIIFDASWNPSFDVQAIFRAYRFGQKKPVYVYRFLAQGTMEEKIYERQIAKLSLSERVVDERNVDRHYSANDLSELYAFRPKLDEPSETPPLPKDLLLADLLNSHGQLIMKVQEHDSLLENKIEEQLSEEERKAAWNEYQVEKDRAAAGLPATGPALSDAPLNHISPFNLPVTAYAGCFLSVQEKSNLIVSLRNRFPAMREDAFRSVCEAQIRGLDHARFTNHLKKLNTAAGYTSMPTLTAKQTEIFKEKMEAQMRQQAQQQYNWQLMQHHQAQQRHIQPNPQRQQAEQEAARQRMYKYQNSVTRGQQH